MYYNRLIEEIIALKLKTSGAVLVAGPKFCGKTTTCMLQSLSLQIAFSCSFLFSSLQMFIL